MTVVDEKNYNSKKETTEQRGVIGHIGDTISNAYNFVAEKVQGPCLKIGFSYLIHLKLLILEAANVVSFDPNKDKVKNPDNTINERGSTGFATAGDKIEEKSHHARAENT